MQLINRVSIIAFSELAGDINGTGIKIFMGQPLRPEFQANSCGRMCVGKSSPTYHSSLGVGSENPCYTLRACDRFPSFHSLAHKTKTIFSISDLGFSEKKQENFPLLNSLIGVGVGPRSIFMNDFNTHTFRSINGAFNYFIHVISYYSVLKYFIGIY